MIEVKGLTKRYGNLVAADNLNFTVQEGEILGFLGPNGAGKSTTMKMMTGYMPSTEGTVLIDGLDIIDDAQEAKRKIGYVPEIPPLYKDMTVTEYLRFVSELKNIPKKEIKEKIQYAVSKLRLEDVKNRLIRNISKGFRQRVGLAQAILGKPEILILDEPTVGLDPKQIIEMRELIRELGKEHTIMISSHILFEINQLCERVIIINKGKIVAIDSPENLSKRLSTASRLSLRIVGDEEKVINTIKEIPGVQSVSVIGQVEQESYDYNVLSDTNYDIRKRVFFDMSKAGFPILEMKTVELTLEEVFLQLTGLSEKGEGVVEEGESEDE
ncbi:ABC transporter ATP-binding protein [Sporosalibacterium faouarense]|uniref:ABC transporter ATP-binding protein n=1 Tax=Sporosalibacterium faouarense TaxID=516123 RepID=UPI00141C1670|nr:ABC transporter ATP-binding protein [Sporosalibacterium faouarense]MTI47447.1 ABC transporter ATP-binding protein [Bacillota bacterium]